MNMSRLQKIKLGHIKKANELLDKGHTEKYPSNTVKLKPSNNVTTNSASFVNKMNNLKEEDITPGTHPDLFYDDDFRKMKEKYGGEKELSPTQQSLHDSIMSYVGQTFGSWMSPNNPPFAQEYAKPPYFDRLSKGIRDIIINNIE